MNTMNTTATTTTEKENRRHAVYAWADKLERAMNWKETYRGRVSSYNWRDGERLDSMQAGEIATTLKDVDGDTITAWLLVSYDTVVAVETWGEIVELGKWSTTTSRQVSRWIKQETEQNPALEIFRA